MRALIRGLVAPSLDGLPISCGVCPAKKKQQNKAPSALASFFHLKIGDEDEAAHWIDEELSLKSILKMEADELFLGPNSMNFEELLVVDGQAQLKVEEHEQQQLKQQEGNHQD